MIDVLFNAIILTTALLGIGCLMVCILHVVIYFLKTLRKFANI